MPIHYPDPAGSRCRPFLRTLILAAILPLAAIATPSLGTETASLDSFYASLLTRGQAARVAGEPEAVNMLRIACFGMLEAPPRLAGCLVELALAQAGSTGAPDEGLRIQDPGGFDESVRRLVDIERRFQAYTLASQDASVLSASVASTFQRLLAARAPSSLLDTIPAFREAAVQRRTQELGRLAPEARQSELEQLMALQPQEPRWRHELAQLALDTGNTERAFELATQLPIAEYACTRSRARAAVGDCAGAMAEATACQAPVPEAVWNAQLTCTVAANDWRAASDLLNRLPAALRGQKTYRRLARTVARGMRTLPATIEVDPATEDSAETVASTQVAPDPALAANPPNAQQPPVSQATTTAQPSEQPATRPPTGTTAATTEVRAGAEAVTRPPAAPPQQESPPSAPSAAPARAPSELAPLLDRSRRALLGASTEDEVLDLLTGAESMRERFGDHSEVMLHIAEVNYRLRRWRATIEAVQASGLDLETRPRFLFYYAVALYESGDRAAAASAIERAWPQIRQTDFVRAYATKILGREPS